MDIFYPNTWKCSLFWKLYLNLDIQVYVLKTNDRLFFITERGICIWGHKVNGIFIRREEHCCLHFNRIWFFYIRTWARIWETKLWRWRVLTLNITYLIIRPEKEYEIWNTVTEKRLYFKTLLWFLSMVMKWPPGHGLRKGTGPF